MDDTQRTNINIVIAFAEILMLLRDPYENGHDKRCAELSVLLANKLCLPDEQIEQIGYAARLHDIGKIMIAEQILNKTRLTTAEMNMIRSHSSMGAKALKSLGFDDPIQSIILQHHENWDGTGYPNKLQGENILIGARIIRIADCFDAMTSERSYRKSLTKERTIVKMEKENGKSFDPMIFELLRKIIES